MERLERCGRALERARLISLLAFAFAGCASGGGGHGVGVDPIVGNDASVSPDADAGSDEGGGDGNDGDSPQGDGGGLPDPPPYDPNDVDGDGSRGGVDCNDNDATIHPDAPEVCDGKDNDCDGFADVFAIDATTYYPDEDEDGLGNGATPVRACQAPMGWVVNSDDCDDKDPLVGRGSGGEFCDVTERPVIYVAKHGHDDNSGAGPMEAVLTVNVGISRALACPDQPCSVLIAGGTYEEAVTVADGVSMFGGYTQDFMALDPVAGEVIITSTQERTLTASAITTPTRIDRITIRGAVLEGNDGRASYAVSVHDTADALRFTNMHIVAGRGADGAPGGEGVPQTCAALGGPGRESFDCGARSGSTGNAGGDPVRGGEGGDAGRSYCVSACPAVGSDGISGGGDGKPGLSGADGAGGNPATDGLGSFASDGTWLGAQSEPGQRGFHGTGGGGGGSGGSKGIAACFGCSTILGGRGADGAPGGCGGGGGAPGQAGGGAFALALFNAKVALESSVLEGGQGGKGGTGGAGIQGQEGSQVTGLMRGEAQKRRCGLIDYWSGAGGIGGVGGKGGTGGGGAGGTGGAAVTLAIIGDAGASFEGEVTVLPGTGGEGGAGGASPANAGAQGLAGAAADTHNY